MKLAYTKRFLQQYAKAPARVRKDFEKQGALLLENLRHPSIRAKKYDEPRDIWQGRVNDDWRFYFSIAGDTYTLHTIRKHPK
jgi:mRNA-degrading endonuclease RelE of RelBE toxin-antitoxin system